MANWNNPTVTSAYTDVPTEIKDRDIDTATWFEGSTSTNIPTNTKRYNPSSNTFETWDGASWNQLDLSLASFISGVGNNQVLYTNGSGAVTGSSGLTFDGSNLTVSGNLTVDIDTLSVDAVNNRVVISKNTYPTSSGSLSSLVVSGSGTYITGKQNAIFTAPSGKRSTVRLRSEGDDPTDLIFDVDGVLRWCISARGSSDSNSLYIYSQGSSLTTVGSPVFELSQSGNLGIAGNLTVDTNTLFVDAGTNRVGIGINPSAWKSDYRTLEIGASLGIECRDGGSFSQFVQNAYRNSSNQFIRKVANYMSVFRMINGGMVWSTGDTGAAGAAATVTDTMWLSNAGTLSVGGAHGALGKLDSRATSGAQIVASYDGSNALHTTVNSSGQVVMAVVGSVPSFTYRVTRSGGGATLFNFNNLHVNATGMLLGFQTEGVTRGSIGALGHGASGHIMFNNGETADGLGIRAETVMQFGIGSTGVMQMTSTGLAIGGLFSPASVLDIRKSQPTIRLRDTSGAGSAARAYLVYQDNTGSDMGYVGYGSTSYPYLYIVNYLAGDIFLTTNANSAVFNSSGNLGVGVTSSVSARIHSVSTTEQLRLGYNTSNYASHTVNSSGDYTIAPSGSLFTVTLSSRSLVLSSPSFDSLLLNSGSASMTGQFNTGIGVSALPSNTTGSANTGIGASALQSNTTGFFNTGIGVSALVDNTTGYSNTGIGYRALFKNTTGTNNTGIGRDALTNLQTGSNNIGIGYNVGASSTSVSNEITLGNNAVTALRCNVTTISSLSDRRDKSKIKEIQNALDFINDLMPVSFEWKRRDGSMEGVKDSGFIAQDLDEAQKRHNIDYLLNLVYKSNPEKLEASYGKLLPMIVKAVQELNAKVDALADQ